MKYSIVIPHEEIDGKNKRIERIKQTVKISLVVQIRVIV